ncbi:hypothetical protein CBR_g16011 [Chara braunii]|uniref:Uncharacterized protein n=1 Tax=Chara braunii TaxID=69332 RepID=A0A388JSX6_CHABU|nr:hypothetical protein CBR_g16011 [Chara braunii]|eukprot:GBG60891.1 hypothetical protein CBR_g16011 [Chara braunii]
MAMLNWKWYVQRPRGALPVDDTSIQKGMNFANRTKRVKGKGGKEAAKKAGQGGRGEKGGNMKDGGKDGGKQQKEGGDKDRQEIDKREEKGGRKGKTGMDAAYVDKQKGEKKSNTGKPEMDKEKGKKVVDPRVEKGGKGMRNIAKGLGKSLVVLSDKMDEDRLTPGREKRKREDDNEAMEDQPEHKFIVKDRFLGLDNDGGVY